MYEVLIGARFHGPKNKIFENESELISKEDVVVSIKCTNLIVIRRKYVKINFTEV
jgi:hypothetical protein